MEDALMCVSVVWIQTFQPSSLSLSLFLFHPSILNSFISSYGTDNGSYEKFINKVEN